MCFFGAYYALPIVLGLLNAYVIKFEFRPTRKGLVFITLVFVAFQLCAFAPGLTMKNDIINVDS